MNERQSDFEWLQQFAQAGNQSAFRDLVRRHIDLVFATALRKVGDAGGAEEISQNVFGALAKKAWQFAPDDSLPAWLHKTALLESQAWQRGEMRRRQREQTAVELGTTMKTPDAEPAFRALVPLLDEALLSLREKDREALLLRYYESQSLKDVGTALGVSDDTAQKRVQTALEKPSHFFQRRGFKTATVAVTAIVLQQTAHSAPRNTVSQIANVVLQTAPAPLTGLAAIVAQIIVLSKFQLTAICVAVAIIPVIWHWKNTDNSVKTSETTVKDSGIPPFVFTAEGRLLTQGFWPTRTNRNYQTDASVVFVYSNGWWQVQATYSYLHLTNQSEMVQNCMRIPDGTRSFVLFKNRTSAGLTTMANASPDFFPITGKTELLIPWLALCPNPELPVLDRKRMRRFINLPDYRPNIFNAPENEGFYQMEYLAPENVFLSELVITNNGFDIELNVEKDPLEDKGKMLRVTAPFDNGYTEFRYKVIESTNLNNITFPVRSVCERFYPYWGEKGQNDIRIRLRSELTVTKISFPAKDVEHRIVAPSEMIATDDRPGVSVTYRVHNDQWKPISDPEIARLARQNRKNQR